ncbi:MAG: DUF192 domain-containing protein [Maricaulaceae bacterium]
MIKHIALPALLALTSVSLAHAQSDDLVDFGDTESLTITSGEAQHVFNVEIADTDEKQAQGLMFRKSLGDDAGMLFEFDAPKVATIWMKNTEISLDIVFVRKNGSIVKIEHSAQPQTLRSASSEAVVAAVLELPAGKAQDLGISPGDVVAHSFFEAN